MNDLEQYFLQAERRDRIPQTAEQFQALLWEKAEELSQKKKIIEAFMEVIYAERKSPDWQHLSVAEKKEKEDEYWQHDQELRRLIEEEKALENELLELEDGRVNKEKLFGILGIVDEPEQEERLSKKKRREREYIERLMSDPRMVAAIRLGIVPPLRLTTSRGSYNFANRKPESTRVTTGHDKRRVKHLGQVTPEQAQAIFEERTADTHQGKVRK